MAHTHEIISYDSDTPRSGTSARYEWIWDSAGRAQRLPTSSAPTTPEPHSSDEEDSHFVRRGGSTSNCAQMRALRARNREQQAKIEHLRNVVENYVIADEVTQSINAHLQEEIGDMGVAYATLYTSALEIRDALTDALDTSRVARLILSVMTGVVAIFFAFVAYNM